MRLSSSRALVVGLACLAGVMGSPATGRSVDLTRVAAEILSVRVLDATGAAIADAEVILTPSVSGLPTTVRTRPDGAVSVEGLGTEAYTLTVTKPGFRPVSRAWSFGDGASVDVHMELSGVHESITVTEDAAAEAVYKMPATLHETPRSVTVLDSTRIREQNFRSINDAFTYIPGIAVNSYRTGGYHFYARGYRMQPEDTRVDGAAGVNAGGRYGASLFGIEQAVLLRGPAGLLYGPTASPGGMINLITKKPQETSLTRFDLRTGGYAGGGVALGDRGMAAVELDSTGPLTTNGRVLYRTLFTVEQMNYFTADVLDENRYANASLTFKLDEQARYVLTPMVQWTRFNRPAGGGIIVSPSTSLTTNDGSAGPINLEDLSPLDVNLSFGGGLDETVQAGFELRANLSPALRVNGTYRFIAYDTDIDQFAPQVTTSAQREQLEAEHTVSRVQSKSEIDRRYHNFDLNAGYELRPGGSWKSLTQVGVYSRFASTRQTSLDGPAPGPQSPIDIYTGAVSQPLVPNHPDLIWGEWTDTTLWNAYLQNRTSLAQDRFVVTLGLGYGENHIQEAATRKSDLMPNLALLFNATRQLALYASYATSFNPTDPEAEDAEGRRGVFDPASGLNYEAGVKYDLADRRASATLSVFHNEIDNALVQSAATDLNPNGNRYFTEAGTRRARGIELSAEVLPLPELRLTGAVAYLDAVYTGEGPESAAATLPIPGSRAEKAPQWAFNLWSRYDRIDGPLEGFGAGVGIVWQADRLGSNGARTPTAPDPLLLPSFTRLDAALFYRLNQHVDLALNLENLLDETIFVNGSVGSNLEVASPRAVNLRVGYRF